MIGYVIRRLLYGVLILIGVNLFTFILFFAVNTPDDMARLAIGGSASARTRWRNGRSSTATTNRCSTRRGAGRRAADTRCSTSARCRCWPWNSAPRTAGATWPRSHAHGAQPGAGRAHLPAGAVRQHRVLAHAGLFPRHAAGFLGRGAVRDPAVDLQPFYIIAGQWLFAKTLRLVPFSGFSGGLDMAKFLALPVLVAIISRLGPEARYRTLFLEEIGKDYVRTARARAWPSAVLFRHVLRNAMLPILTSTVAALPLLFMAPDRRILLRHSRPAATPSTPSTRRTFPSCAPWCSWAPRSTSWA